MSPSGTATCSTRRPGRGGGIPGAGALVHVPAGGSVAYQGASAAPPFIVRVDGELSFTARDGAATRMVVDAMLTAPASRLAVAALYPTDGTADVAFAEGEAAAAHPGFCADGSAGDGVIGRHGWEPQQLSLGLVAAGEVEAPTSCSPG